VRLATTPTVGEGIGRAGRVEAHSRVCGNVKQQPLEWFPLARRDHDRCVHVEPIDVGVTRTKRPRSGLLLRLP
jgi:hypothetical protein